MRKVGLFLTVLFCFVFVMPATALNSCIEVFTVRLPHSGATNKATTELANDLEKMNTVFRIGILEGEIAQLAGQMKPTPGVLQRIFSEKAFAVHTKNKRINAELKKLRHWLSIYQYMEPMMRALKYRGSFDSADEVQLLNRVIESEKLYDAIQFLNQRFKDLSNRSPVEKKFLDAVAHYLTWGPDFSKDRIPVHHWVMFEILIARNNLGLLEKMAMVFYQSADSYKIEKQKQAWIELEPGQAKVEEYWLIQQDPAYKIIEQTNPEQIDQVINEAIDKGRLDYDNRVHSFRIGND